jgi:hypothetical protein
MGGGVEVCWAVTCLVPIIETLAEQGGGPRLSLALMNSGPFSLRSPGRNLRKQERFRSLPREGIFSETKW